MIRWSSLSLAGPYQGDLGVSGHDVVCRHNAAVVIMRNGRRVLVGCIDTPPHVRTAEQVRLVDNSLDSRAKGRPRRSLRLSRGDDLLDSRTKRQG